MDNQGADPAAGPFLSVIIPAFDEESRIGSALEELTRHLSGKPYEWEIIVADDGSTDRTREIVENAAASDPRIRYLGLRHGGKGWAINRWASPGLRSSGAPITDTFSFAASACSRMRPIPRARRWKCNDGPPNVSKA